jgi:DNA repair exonuclease SbcCD nuclease subunit
MRILVVGDPHISHKRSIRSQEFLTELARIINSSNTQLTVILGDVFDEHEWVHVACSTMWSQFLESLDKSKEIIHLLGNHEMINAHDYPAQIHALHAYNTHMHYRIVDSPIMINDMAFVPYIPTGKFTEATQGLSGRLMFCHQEFTGSVAPDKGDARPSEAWRVISGHIHDAVTIGNVWYPGSPLQHSFGEDDNKAIHIIDFDGMDYKIVQKMQLQLARFETITVEWNDTALPLLLNPENAYYRFVVTAKRTEIAIFKASPLYKELLGIGKVKLNILPEERTQKKREGVTFRSALAEMLATEDLKEIADEVGA